MPIYIGRGGYIGFANKKVNIGSLTDIRMYYLFSWFSPNIILSKLKYDEKNLFNLSLSHKHFEFSYAGMSLVWKFHPWGGFF